MSERPRLRSEWTEEDGEVLWWRFPIEEPPYVGTPNDLGQPVLITTKARFHDRCGTDPIPGQLPVREEGDQRTIMVGGWPGYHTHWTPIPIPEEPT